MSLFRDFVMIVEHRWREIFDANLRWSERIGSALMCAGLFGSFAICPPVWANIYFSWWSGANPIVWGLIAFFPACQIFGARLSLGGMRKRHREELAAVMQTSPIIRAQMQYEDETGEYR